MGRRRRRYRRGYPIAILVAFTEWRVRFWCKYRYTTKPMGLLKRERKAKNFGEKDHYHFHEAIIDVLRPKIREGLKSIILINPPKTEFNELFLDHVNNHHMWLKQSKDKTQVRFGIIEGRADDFKQLNYLLEQPEFNEVLLQTFDSETGKILERFEKLLSLGEDEVRIGYGLRECEAEIYQKWVPGTLKPDYLLVTKKCLNTHPAKQRIHRLIQIAKNKGVKTRVLDKELDAADRINQFGGLVCFSEVAPQD